MHNAAALQMSSPAVVKRGSVLFLMVSLFISFVSVGIVVPVLPYIVGNLTTPTDRALVTGLLTTVFSLGQFLSVPALGALSDRYGRRPVLLICMFGTAVGYLIFGIGGALWVLFLGRIIDGITGGNIAAVYAYAADITDKKDRTRFFGLLGAVGSVGYVIGPAIGVLVYGVTGDPVSVLFLVAAITLVTSIWGYFVLEESLPLNVRKSRTISVSELNPLTQLSLVIRAPGVRPLLIANFLWGIVYSVLQGNLSTFSHDQLGWTVVETSGIFFAGGLAMVIGQGVLLKPLLTRLGEARVALVGFGLCALGYALIIGVGAGASEYLMYAALILSSLGIGLINPSLTGLISLSAGADEQGRVQGGRNSLQALSRVVGPLWAGWSYTAVGAAAPYASGIVLLALVAGVVGSAKSGKI